MGSYEYPPVILDIEDKVYNQECDEHRIEEIESLKQELDSVEFIRSALRRFNFPGRQYKRLSKSMEWVEGKRKYLKDMIELLENWSKY